MDKGWVKIWRKTLDSGILQNPPLCSFWMWCLLKASYKRCKVSVGFQEVPLKPGEFVFGRKNAAIELKLSEQTIRTCVDTLKKRQSITIKSTNRFSVITITNWDIYQGDECETNHQSNQQMRMYQP